MSHCCYPSVFHPDSLTLGDEFNIQGGRLIATMPSLVEPLPCRFWGLHFLWEITPVVVWMKHWPTFCNQLLYIATILWFLENKWVVIIWVAFNWVADNWVVIIFFSLNRQIISTFAQKMTPNKQRSGKRSTLTEISTRNSNDSVIGYYWISIFLRLEFPFTAGNFFKQILWLNIYKLTIFLAVCAI